MVDVQSVHKVTHKRVLTIALPIVLSNASIPILGAVDTGVIGQLGDASAIGAVGVGAIVLTSIYWIFGFLRMGTTGFVAQALGRDDTLEVNLLLVRALLIGVTGGLLIMAINPLLFNGAFFVSPVSQDVEDLSRIYMGIRVFSAPAIIAIYGITGWLIAQERTGAVLILQLGMSVLNALLDMWFVLGLNWGISGVAWATFIAEYCAFFLGLLLCRKALFQVHIDWSNVFDTNRLMSMMRVNRDILLRSLLLQAMFVSFLLIGGKFGDVQLAANQVLLQFLHITAYGLDGFAFAAESLVGQAVGQRNKVFLRRSIYVTGFWAIFISAVAAVLFLIMGPWLIDQMAKVDTVQQAARVYLPYMAIAPIFGVLPFMMDGVFIGATKSQDMRNMMAYSFIIYVISLGICVPWLGNHGLWISLLVSYIARGVSLCLCYPKLEREI